MPIGARLNGLANASVTLIDPFSVFVNPANLANTTKPTLGLFADHRYSLSGLNILALAYSQNYKSWGAGVGVARYGDELLNHTRVEFALAYKIRMVSLGAGVGYHQLMIMELGTASRALFQLGGRAELTPKLTYAASVYNLARAKVSSQSSIYYPVVMKMGLSYIAIKQVVLMGEVEKSSDSKTNFKAALEYSLLGYLQFRTGVNTFPSQGFLGVGLKWKGASLDYAISFHSRLGNVHALGLTCVFGKKQSEEKR